MLKTTGALAAIDRLRRLAERLPALGDDGAWLAAGLNRYLDPRAGISLEEAVDLNPSTAGGEHWRSAMKRALRDQALRELAKSACPGLSVSRQADEVRRLLRRHLTTRWQRTDRYRAEVPPGYRGTSNEHLFAALFHGNGRVLRHSRLREILTPCQATEKSADSDPDFIGDDAPYPALDQTMDGSMSGGSSTLESKDVIDLLAKTPALKAAMAERDAAMVLRRRGMIGEIRKLDREAERNYAKLTDAVDAAVALVKEREAALWAARQAYDVAVAAKSTASFAYTRQRDLLEAELRESANPAIDAFVDEMRDALYATRKALGSVERVARNEVTNKSRHVVISNIESVNARVAAINAAIERAQELRVTEADQSVVPAKLETLRAGLPIVSQPHVAEA